MGKEGVVDDANAMVHAMVVDATNALKAGDINAARETLKSALAIPHANTLVEARTLYQQIDFAIDPARIRAALVEIPYEAFLQLQLGGEMPEQFLSGYETLDSRTSSLARAQLAEVAAIRQERRLAAFLVEHKRQGEQERHRVDVTPLVVESWRWHIESGFAIAEGEVTNRSDQHLKNLVVVVSYYTEDNHFITSSDAIVKFNPTLPGQTTPFVAYATHNPRMKSARIAFKQFGSGTISYEGQDKFGRKLQSR